MSERRIDTNWALRKAVAKRASESNLRITPGIARSIRAEQLGPTRSIFRSLRDVWGLLLVALFALLIIALVFDDEPAAGAQPPDIASPWWECPTLEFEWPRGTVWFAGGADGGRCEISLTVICERARRDGSVRSWPVQRTEWLADGETAAWRIRCGGPKRTDAVRFDAHGYPVREAS